MGSDSQKRANLKPALDEEEQSRISREFQKLKLSYNHKDIIPSNSDEGQQL